jgi:hypothetical protein
MQLTEEILAEITETAKLLFSVEEVALIVGIPPLEAQKWWKNPNTQFSQAYLRGRLLTEADVRKTAITLAKQGSTPALEAVKKYKTQSDVKNV